MNKAVLSNLTRPQSCEPSVASRTAVWWSQKRRFRLTSPRPRSVMRLVPVRFFIYQYLFSSCDYLDAWLDSAEVDTKFAAKLKAKAKDEEEVFQDLTSDDVGKIKRIIADILQPGETIIQALKRLKGTTDNKTKMSEETKEIFDQLTESAMKLMENGEYNVYHEEKETFEREAEGYERLARARGDASGSGTEDIFAFLISK
ncbi:hypothetical protein FCM35_KLT16754 [Carex littledalei]|uniref:Uncharacterized protein n=1 Tax=Carex littledalei TaxID=544730 RepID=A0A833VX80_9POAL|nr:hypothetical protein FCM35_KLT16754 [Carex littledalei]